MDDAKIDALLTDVARVLDSSPEAAARLAQAYAAGHPALRRLARVLQTAERAESRREEALRRRFGLTQQEARVAVHLIDGGTVASCAALLGVAVSTVRTHLRAVFSKAEISRQSQLASLLAQGGGDED